MNLDCFLRCLQVQHASPARVEIYRRELLRFADYLQKCGVDIENVTINDVLAFIVQNMDPFLDRPNTYWAVVALTDLFRHLAFEVRLGHTLQGKSSPRQS